MYDVKNSALLNALIKYAGLIGTETECAVSTKRFLIAVCDFVIGAFAVEGEKEARKRLADTLLASGKDIRKIRNDLLSRLDEDEASRKADESYFSAKMLAAKFKALGEHTAELTPEKVLEIILKDFSSGLDGIVPDPSLADLFAGSEKPGETVPKNVFDQPKKEAPRGVASLTKDVKRIRDGLGKIIFGQENAINIFTHGYFQAEMRSSIDPSRTRPAATFLFAGAPGVGKTYLATEAARLLALPCRVFDMSEYADSQSYMALVGYNNNYKAPKEGLLTGFVKKNPKCVLIFDEIEKAHLTTVHLFLQILDAGRLTDSNTEKEVSFGNAMIIFTTNAGKELYRSSESGDFTGVSRKVILKALQNEVNPLSGQPFFPPAICSRFASGNVVLFNNMTASSLCRIAENEAERFIGGFEKKYGVSVRVTDRVYAALLFSEGGAADARTVTSRTEKFFNDEMFELFRFLSAESDGALDSLRTVTVDVALPESGETRELFVSRDDDKVVLFTRTGVGLCGDAQGISVTATDDAERFAAILRERSAALVLLDLDTADAREYLDIADVSSPSRDALRFVREKYPDVPVYVLQRGDRVLNDEEKKSFLNDGVSGFIPLDGDGNLPVKDVAGICDTLYRQNSMRSLARSNSLLTFETGQSVGADGKDAAITLFDLRLTTAVDAEDKENVMSNVSKPDVKFSDIIGAKNAKEELRFFIDYLRDPNRFAETGLRAPKGVLLYGPPGTGKTLLAKAAAAEAGVTFISAEGNQFIKKYVGEGKDALHDLFAVARKYSPSILFIDEFEAIAKERRGGDLAAANGEDVLTALLTEMDGFHTDVTKPVFVLAATNFSVEPGTGRSLDPAILRRFDSKILVDLPDKEERIRFFRKKIDGNRAFDISEEETENLALRSTGMSLADLDSVFELSLRTAIRTADHKVTDKVLDEAFETFTGGAEKKWDISELERVARHEAGHAYLCWQSGETPSYVTVVARGDHGGYMQHNTEEGKGIFTKDELLSRIRTSLGGRAAEIVYYGEKDGISTGASGDLSSATSLARQIVCSYGMDDGFGLCVMNDRSQEMPADVRGAVNAILQSQMTQAVERIGRGREAIDALVGELMSKNHLTGAEIDGIFRRFETK